jgi:DNA-binding MarR family transcriptional regulator
MDEKARKLYLKHRIDTDVPFCTNHLRVLAVACHSHSPRFGLVAEYLNLSKSTVVRAMDRLEAHGLAERIAGYADGRHKLLVATKKGRAFEKALTKPIERAKPPRHNLAAQVRRLGADSLLP